MIDCIGFPMGFFIGVTEDGRIIFGKRDPITKEVLEVYEYDCDRPPLCSTLPRLQCKSCL